MGKRVAMVVLCCTLATTSLQFAYEAGRADVAQLALDAFEREVRGRKLSLRLLDVSTRAMSVVLQVDAELHEEVRTVVPEWRSTIMLSRAVWGVAP